jgi:integrase
MKPKKPLTDRGIQALKAAASGQRRLVWDAIVPGLAVRVTDQGVRTFVLVTRYPGSRSPAPRSLGVYGAITLEAARIKAREWLALIAAGTDPAAVVPPAAPMSVAAVLEDFVARYVRAKGRTLRSAALIESAFARHVKPRIGKIEIYKLRRSAVAAMLNEIAKASGPVAADRTLAYLSKALNWFAMGDDEFVSPIVRGMARTKPRERARDRVLSEAELRAVWLAAESAGVFGRYLRFTLLTAVRRTEAARMKWTELDGDLWIIPAARMKAKAEHVIPLSTAALELLGDRQGPFVFTTDGVTAISGFSKFKAQFDKASGVQGWRLHDLRRTARTLLTQAGVKEEVAEQCLAHVIGGVRGVYNRHQYLEEKRQAFEALASLVLRIVEPAANVVAIKGRP